MRQDMRKVLTDRPRHGSAGRYHAVRPKENRGDFEDLPSYQGMRRPYHYGWGDYMKEFSDHISPLSRFLWGCVGRPWDAVWSEICAAVPSGNTVDSHLRGHVLAEVETNTYVVDGEVFVKPTRRWGGNSKATGLYVDPETGLLLAGANDRHNDKNRHKDRNIIYYRKKSYTKGDDGVLYPTAWWNCGHYPIKLIDGHEACQINGIWYWVDYDEVPSGYSMNYVDSNGESQTRLVPHHRVDVVSGVSVHSGWYRSSKKQICSRDLKRHGLKNAA